MRPVSSRQLREFGLLVGGVLACGGAFVLLRRHQAAMGEALLAAGVLLAALGAVAPGLLAVPYRIWMGAGRAAGWVTTRVLLAVVYYAVLTPIGLLRRLFGGDPFRGRGRAPVTNWRPYPEGHRSRTHYEKMY